MSPIIDPWVVYTIIGLPLGVAVLSLLAVAVVGTGAWRRVPVPLVAAVVVLLVVMVPHWLWA